MDKPFNFGIWKVSSVGAGVYRDMETTKTPKTGDLPEWAKGTLRPACPACGLYLLPCVATKTGIHPKA